MDGLAGLENLENGLGEPSEVFQGEGLKILQCFVEIALFHFGQSSLKDGDFSLHCQEIVFHDGFHLGERNCSLPM